VLPITHTFGKPAVPLDLTPYIDARGPTRVLGFRAVAYSLSGKAISDAYVNATLQVEQNDNDPITGQPTNQTSDTIPVDDDSYMTFCAVGSVKFTGAAGYSYDLFVGEQYRDDIKPGGYGAINAEAGGSTWNNPDNVTQTTQTFAPGYTPTTDTDGASIQAGKGVRLNFNAGTWTWVDGGLIECYRALSVASTGEFVGWERVFELDRYVPNGSAALGAGGTWGTPDIEIDVGTAGSRLMYVPSSGAVTGGSGDIASVIEVQT
jgi:hypothetical protein